jgi:hypothetical protein
MMPQTRNFHATVLVCLVALTTTGCSMTRVTSSRVEGNPLSKVAERAQYYYTVKWADENMLTLSKPCVWHSVLSLGYTARHAELRYVDNQLESDYYVKMNNLFTFFLPVYVDTSDSAGSWLLRVLFLPPPMERRMQDILDWAGVAPSDRRERFVNP